MKYAVFILAFLVQGIRCQNCTRTNSKGNFCGKSCDPTQDDCKGNRACVCDGDCGFSCIKPDLRCPRPADIKHGRVRYKNTTLGSVARYKCFLPATLEGPRRRTCRGNGDWDGKKPACKVICADPGNIQHGTKYHDGFESDKQVKYSCSRGFTMQGRSTLTCGTNGRWDRVKPNCTCMRTNERAFRYCRSPCDAKKSTCRGNKECVCDGDCGYSCVSKGLNCGRPKKIQNGRRQYSSTSLGSIVRYQCDKPYSLLGAKIRTCRGIREWDGTEPECKILCQDPGDIAHGNKQIHRKNYDEDYITVGDGVEYNCYPGYKMEGSKILTCNARGKWDRPKPKCNLPTCDAPQIPANAILYGASKGKTSYKYSESVLFRCKTGYFSRGLGRQKCGSDGWSRLSFVCSPKSCGHPESPRNGKILSYVFTFKSKVYFQCDHGYKLVGDKFRQCQSNQEWSGRRPRCEQIDCGVLPVPDKAEKVLETHTRVDGVVRFKCKEKGYKISGSEMRTCQNNGLWNGVTTSCKIIHCGNPGTPLNGKQVNVQNNYNYGGSVEFVCNDNYTLAGKRKITCEETKDWSSPIPRCWAPCSDPGVPSNGSRTGNNFLHGNSVNFECHRGFELEGDKTMTCTDGGWNGFKPQCKAVSCGDPGTPLHGRQAKATNSYSYGGFIRFKCDQFYTLEGKSKLTCQANKKWNGKIPKCLAPCPKPNQPLHGKTIRDDFTHGAVVKFECVKGYFLKGSPAMRCNNGQWNTTLPMCTDCDGRGKPLGMSNGLIPDSSIRASSQRDRNHAAHYGRLGGNSYWCSKNEIRSDMEIDLPKKYKITAVTIELQDSSNIGWILLYSHPLQKWIHYYTEYAPLSPGNHQIVVTKPFVADRIKIRVIRFPRKPDSLCLKAEIYGCEVPRGCIMAGSAVFVKWYGAYLKGYVGTIESVTNRLEILQIGPSLNVPRVDAVLDEKPSSSELIKGTLVLVKDLNSGLITKAEIVQTGNPLCSVKTVDGIVRTVGVNNVRLVKQSNFCPT